jgi:hypothetical protein
LEETIVETDELRSIDSVHDVNRTSDAATDAACALANVAPTTMAGVVALLQYAISIQPENGRKACSRTTTPRPGHGIPF